MLKMNKSYNILKLLPVSNTNELKINEFYNEYNSSLTVLNKKLYCKIFFVETDNVDSAFSTVDTNDDFVFSIFESKKAGQSLNAKSFFFRNNLTDEIFFFLSTLPFYKKCFLIATKLSRLFFRFENNHKLKTYKKSFGLIVIKTKRGGYKCFYLGVLGLLDKKSYRLALYRQLDFMQTKSFVHSVAFFSKLFHFNIKNFQRLLSFFTVEIKRIRYTLRQKTHLRRKFKKKKLHPFLRIFFSLGNFKD